VGNIKGDLGPVFFDILSGNVLATTQLIKGQSVLYHLVKIHPLTGEAREEKLDLPEGIMTSWTFDPNTQILYGGLSNGMIFPIDTRNVTVGTGLNVGIVPSNLQVAY